MASHEPAHWEGAHLGIPYPQMAQSRTGGSSHLDGHRRRRGEVLNPIQGHYQPPEGRTMEYTDTLRPGTKRVNAGSRSKAPAAVQERGEELKGIDSKAVFVRPQPGSGALAGRGLRV